MVALTGELHYIQGKNDIYSRHYCAQLCIFKMTISKPLPSGRPELPKRFLDAASDPGLTDAEVSIIILSTLSCALGAALKGRHEEQTPVKKSFAFVKH